MRYYEMKRYAVAAYLNCVLNCERVLYEVNAFKGRDFEVDIIGCRSDKLTIFVDLAEKFSHYPREMKQVTLHRKLVQRYTSLKHEWLTRSLRHRFEIWCFGTPPEKLELVLSGVREELHKEHGISLDVVGEEDVKERLNQTIEALLKGGNCDYTNPFVQAILIGSGVLELPKHNIAQMPSKLPFRLPSAWLIPDFVFTMLDSEYVVGWLGFDVDAFDLLTTIAHEKKGGVWEEFLMCFPEASAVSESTAIFVSEDEDIDWHSIDWTELPVLELKRYNSKELVSALKIIFANASEFLEAWQARVSNTMLIKIDYLLPFVFKHPRFSLELIEAEVVRYGGDRELVRMHTQVSNPDKRPYRGSIVIELANSLEHMRFSDVNSIMVPIDDPRLMEDVVAGLWLTYKPEFAGYFQLTFDALMPRWQGLCNS